MEHAEVLAARENLVKKKEKRQERVGTSFWTLHYRNKISTYSSSPPHPPRPGNLEIHLVLQVNFEDIYVCMDHGTQRYSHRIKSKKKRWERLFHMPTLLSRRGNYIPPTFKLHLLQRSLAFNPWTTPRHSWFTSRSHHPAPELELPLPFSNKKKGSTLHSFDNSPKINSLEDLARTK
jgi:hypothetical protein